MSNFFVPANVVKSNWILVGNDVVEIDTTKRVLVGLASTTVVGNALVVNTDTGGFVLVKASSPSPLFNIDLFANTWQILSTAPVTAVPITIQFPLTVGESVRFDTTGNTGFGSAAPSVKVHAKNGADAWNVYSERSAGAITGLYSSTTQGRLGTNSNHPLGISINGVDKIYIDTAGNVGVGNTAPTQKLDVTGNINVSGNSMFAQITTSGSPANSYTGTGINAVSNFINAVGGTFKINIGQTSDPGSNFIGTSTATDLGIITNNTNRISIFSASGNVTINSLADAGFKLYVNGTLRATGITTLDGALNVAQATTISGATKIGNNVAPVASALLELQPNAPNQGFLPPRMTTAQKNAIAAPAEGLQIYDLTLHKMCVFTTVWETITSV